MQAIRIAFLILSFFSLLLSAGLARSQYNFFPNKIVVIPPLPVANGPADFAQFTVVVPVGAVRFLGDTIVQPNVSPIVDIAYNHSPPYGGVIDIKIAQDTDGIVFTAQTYDATGVPVLVAVRSPGPYTINYYTKSRTVDDPYVLRLSTGISVIAPSNTHKFALENPQPNSYQSGIGVISGWACMPNNLRVRMDSVLLPIRVPGEGPREDTRATCGHADTGFGLLINYNDMMPGQHMLRLESSDPSYVGASVSFTVTLPGDPLRFLTGLNTEVNVPGFPLTGKTTTLIWQQSIQNFSIKATQ